MLRRCFAAMGTEVELYLDADADPAPLDDVENEFHRVESLLSRFRPDSELSRLNRGGAMRVGPELLEVTALSLEARERTGGRFDPTVHDALVSAGYDRTFARLEDDHVHQARRAAPCAGAVTIDLGASTVALEEGFRLDFGGIAKGWAVDRALACLSAHGPALVNAGGDVAGAGRPWHVGIDVPGRIVTLEIDDCALATSGRDRRSWSVDGVELHHLIDPSTGRPSEGDLLTVTVAASSATEAEVLAKSLFLAGDLARAATEADERGVPAILVARSGETVHAGGLE